MSSEIRMLSKFKRKFPIGSLISYIMLNDSLINTGQCLPRKTVGLIVGVNEETLGVKIRADGKLVRQNILHVMSRSRTIQRPFVKQGAR